MDQVTLNLNDLKNKPRIIWIYKQIKNKEAPLACILRNTDPFHALLIIFLILIKAKFASTENRKARKSPLTIWTIKHNPNRDPKFHKNEIFWGAGNFNTLLIIVLIRFRF